MTFPSGFCLASETHKSTNMAHTIHRPLVTGHIVLEFVSPLLSLIKNKPRIIFFKLLFMLSPNTSMLLFGYQAFWGPAKCQFNLLDNLHFSAWCLWGQMMTTSGVEYCFICTRHLSFSHSPDTLWLHRGLCSLTSCSSGLEYSEVEEGMFTRNLCGRQLWSVRASFRWWPSHHAY